MNETSIHDVGPQQYQRISFSGILVCKYIITIIVQSYTGKYHEFVAVCIVTSVQHD